MNVLIDICHPAHVHLLRNTYFELVKNNHVVLVTVKDIPSAKQLLDLFGIQYIEIGATHDSLIKKAIAQLKYNWKLFRLVKKHKINIGIGSSSTLTHISKVTSMHSIFLDDDDDQVQPLTVKYAHPYADVILSPDVLRGKRGRKDCIYYEGYHELAYLHPDRFTPDENVLSELGLKKEDTYFIMRFNAFMAHHDVGIQGLRLENKLRLIAMLEPYGKVFITTERNIEPELKKYQLKIAAHKAHSLISFATLFLGDSQTMTSEAAVLGIPSIRCNSFAGKISYLEEEEHRYDLTYAFLPENFESLIEKLEKLLKSKTLKSDWQQKRNKMLDDKIDVTRFFVWFIENYPKSKQIMTATPEYSLNFK